MLLCLTEDQIRDTLKILKPDDRGVVLNLSRCMSHHTRFDACGTFAHHSLGYVHTKCYNLLYESHVLVAINLVFRRCTIHVAQLAHSVTTLT
jgi:uncharacterized glyoxalase superfamily metalloenzyme YdcJ